MLDLGLGIASLAPLGNATRFADHALALDFAGGRYRQNSLYTPTLSSLAGYASTPAAPEIVRGQGLWSRSADLDRLLVDQALGDVDFFAWTVWDQQVAATDARIFVLHENNSPNRIVLERPSGNFLNVSVVAANVAQPCGQVSQVAGSATTGRMALGVWHSGGQFAAAAKFADGTVDVGTLGGAASMPVGIIKAEIGAFFGGNQPDSPIAFAGLRIDSLTIGEVEAIMAAA